jgi:molybdopterin-guanine dinucleotide biosynthesis protein A
MISPDNSDLPPAYILAGGRSSRFPGDKALANVGGQPQLKSLISQLHQQGYQTTVVADRTDRYRQLGIDSLVDLYQESGPLSGITTALQDLQDRLGEGWLLVLTCDQLKWKNIWLQKFRSLCAGNSKPRQFEIIAWGDQHTPAQTPLTLIPGLYHSSLLPELHQRCQQGQLAVRSLMQDSKVRIHVDTTQSVSPGAYTFNTPEQLQSLIKGTS